MHTDVSTKLCKFGSRVIGHRYFSQIFDFTYSCTINFMNYKLVVNKVSDCLCLFITIAKINYIFIQVLIYVF